MEIRIEHNLPEKKALKCAKQLLSELSHDQAKLLHKPVQMWDENQCKFSFQIRANTVTGTISVLSDTINISAKLPVSLSLFKGIIKETIQKKSREMLDNCQTQDDK